MNFQAFSSLDQQSFHLSKQRQATARECLQVGIECLHAAIADELQDRELLAEACENLLEAIRYNRTEPDAYVGMGYLLWMAGEHQESLLYLNEAVILTPGNPDALQLIQLNQQALVRPAQPAQAPLIPLEADEDDYDQLYDALETRIREEVRQLSSRKPNWFSISTDRFLVERMERDYQALVHTKQQLYRDLAVVDQEIDCGELQKLMKPLEVFLQRATDVLHNSWKKIDLHDMLNSHNDWLDRELRATHLSPNFSRKRFDYLQDDCDQLADTLDVLEQSGEDISELVTAYERMIAKVAQMQDLLDELDLEGETADG